MRDGHERRSFEEVQGSRGTWIKGGTGEQGMLQWYKEVVWYRGVEGSNEVQVRVERGGDEVRPGAFSSAPTCTCKYTNTYQYVDADTRMSVEGRMGGMIPAPNVTSRGRWESNRK